VKPKVVDAAGNIAGPVSGRALQVTMPIVDRIGYAPAEWSGFAG